MSVAELLKRYTGKRYNYLTNRGNKSILLSLRIAKRRGFRKVVIQDQGGWITYLQYPKKLKLEMVKINTNYGMIEPNELSKHLDDETVLLINSMPGYFSEQPMGLISAMCKQKNALLINDASGSIGTENAKYGDIIIGSFGESKPVDLEYGGFIGFDEHSFSKKVNLEDLFEKDKEGKLIEKLKMLPERLRSFEKHHNIIKKELSEMDIIHKDKKGINVVVRFSNISERERIINYCERKSYEWTECPRYIRVNIPAISIEVKRL